MPTEDSPKKESHDNLFYLNQEVYNARILPDLQHLCRRLSKIEAEPFKAQHFLQFHIELPFSMALPDEHYFGCFKSDEEGKSRVLYLYHSREKLEVRPRIVANPKDDLPCFPSLVSKVEMIYVFEEEPDIQTREDISVYFDRLLEYLNTVIIAYQAYTKDIDSHRLTKEMLNTPIAFRLIQLEHWTELSMGMFLVHSNVPFEKPELTARQMEEVLRHIELLDFELNPFISTCELTFRARRAFRDGFYRDAAIYIQSSIESFLAILFRLLLQAEGTLSMDSPLQDIVFIPMVKKEFHSRIGGKWDISNSSTEIGAWYDKTYLLRNRTIHAGYHPSYSETWDALAAATAMQNYVIALIRQAKPPYNALKVYFLDSPLGLEDN